MISLSLELLFCSISLLCLVSAQGTVSLSITPRPTQGASNYISPSFAGFGIEPSNLYSFTGGSRENVLTTNLLKNLAGYTGTPPHLRIGGNTQDYMIWDENMDDYIVRNNPNAMGQGAIPSDHMIIGPKYFEVLNRFPDNTPITFGLNLAYTEADYLDQIATMAEQAVTRLNDVNLVSFEIGNEPDLYAQNGFRTGTWGGNVYTQEWLQRADAVWEQVLRPKGYASNIFEPGATASTIGTSFQINDLDLSGITQLANGSTKSFVASWNQHDYYYYIGVSTYTITQKRFLTLSTTNDQFRDWVLQIKQAANTDLPYALREMGVVGPIGLYGITDVFGAALWSLNFLLYAATLNITMVGMHMTDNSNASAWQPIEMYGNDPFIRPNYYSFAAFDQAIGPTCQAQIGGYILDGLDQTYEGHAAAYSVYQDGTLSSVVLINSNPYNVSDGDRPSLTFELTLDSQFAGQDVYLGYLTNDGADARHSTTFNGISFEESGDGTPTTVSKSQQTVRVGSDGIVTIDVQDSEAVVASIGNPVGELKANESACAAMASASAAFKSGSSTSGTNGGSQQQGSSSGSSASSASSSSAATSSRIGGSRTASSTSATATNGVIGFSKTMASTLAIVILSIVTLICI